MAGSRHSSDLKESLDSARATLAQGDTASALEACEALRQHHPERHEVRLLESHIHQARGDFDAMVNAARAAGDLDETQLESVLRLAECELLDGQVANALRRARRAEELAGEDPMALAAVGDLHTICSDHEAAWRCFMRADKARPDHPRLVYNLASSALATGRLEDAGRLFERVIKLDPEDYDAWYNRSILRRWTPEENHVDGLRYALSRLSPDHPGWAPLAFALAKELEDLESYDESFATLQQAAASRRRRLRYDVNEDEMVLETIENTFDDAWLSKAAVPEQSAGPLFIVGLPRSGTTLVDRMLSSHPSIDSLGEINTLALAIIKGVGPHAGRRAFIEEAGNIDPVDLGRRYRRSTREYGRDGDWLIDKTPLNSLYLGLIARAMPEARIVHLRRHPMDSCYAMYKTLFRMGYPFTYSLQDVGRYVIAHHRLMAHWRKHLGERILAVDYEDLVNQPEVQIRRMLDHLNLPWDEACLSFQHHAGPAATASAVQVRQPLYRSSVGKWRCFEQQLAPLACKLRERGLDVG